MPSVRLVAAISVIIGIIVVVGVVFSISSRPGFPAGNNEKPNTTIHPVFLNNSTNIDTPFVKEYSMPNGTWPNGILVARNGIVWTVGTMSHTLISFDPNQGKIRSSYPIITPEEKANKTNPQSKQGFQMVWSIVEGTDGSIWFPEGGSDPLWRFDPNTEKFQVIHSISAAPMQMKVDQRSGNIWFTTFGSGTFGVIQKIIGNKADIRDNHNDSITTPDVISGQTHGAIIVNPRPPNETRTSDGVRIVNGTLIANRDPAYDDCSNPNFSVMAMEGKNIGNLLNEKKVTWGYFSTGFTQSIKTADGNWHCTYSGLQSNNIFNGNNTAINHYYADVEPFQFYKNTSNPHHIPPTSISG